jgi:SAM-dependent methyltransferase
VTIFGPLSGDRADTVERMPDLRSGDFLLAVLGLASARDLFRDVDQVTRRTAEMRQVVEHTGEFPFDIPLDFDEHGVEDGYTTWSETYDRPGNPALTIDERLTEPALAAAPRGRALDVACGTGRQLARLVARGDDACGVDATAAMAALARARCPDADVRVGTWDALPFGDDEFDLVTCSLALCHATDVAPPIREMARVLRAGGWLLVSDIHPGSTMYGGAAGYPGERPGHVPFVRNHPHHLSTYFAAFTGAGLEVRGLEEGFVDAETAAMLPSHLAFPEATARAFVGAPAIVAFTAVAPAAPRQSTS